MTDFRSVRDLFESLVEASPEDAARRLADDDVPSAVREEVRSLLDHAARAGAFLEHPVDAAPLAEELLTPGVRVGAYVVDRELGAGGMGTVYLAHDERLGRPVCLKAVRHELAQSGSYRERLRQEARLAASLNHPGICAVYALEEHEGALFVVSEFVDGMTLREEMRAQGQPAPESVRTLVLELSRALAAAHEAGIVHRDLKPDNIMRARDGRLKILDFGLARREDDAARSKAPVTQPGAAMGTLAYMSPEQVTGSNVDRRADLFALGVVAYEYATGTHPFDAPTPLATVAKILNEDPAELASRRSDLAPGVVAAIMACLRKPLEQRPETARAVEALVSGTADAPPVPSTTARRWWRLHQRVVFGLYVVAAVAAWLLKEWDVSALSRAAFLVVGLCAAVGGCVRGHLVFVERTRGRGVEAEWVRVRAVLRVLDLVLSTALFLAAGAASSVRPVPSLVAMGLAAGVATAAWLIEPATTAAAFEAPGQPR